MTQFHYPIPKPFTALLCLLTDVFLELTTEFSIESL
jgi:hypothetical protein